MAKSIMIQGTGSNVGKSLLVSGLCRAYSNNGFRVKPFKPQNMSNNAAVADNSGEIGRAQALQAQACRQKTHTDMNPVLLKPETDNGTQVIVQGKRFATLKARDYAKLKPSLLPKVLQSFRRLQSDADLIIIEGAGSPAEINLRAGDIANMGFAQAAQVPVILVGDIDRGGVIAQMVGTHHVISESDRKLIKAFIINKFRGDVSLFNDGLHNIVDFTAWQALGVLPWFVAANQLPAEDSVDLNRYIIGKSKPNYYKIVVPQLPRMANFDDFDPLCTEPNVHLELIMPGQPLPLDADLFLISGTKSTIKDLEFFRQQGWDIDLHAHIRKGGHVLGICGGYQMLGQSINDPLGLESVAGSYAGLGHLNVTTEMNKHKKVQKVYGTVYDTNTCVSGYEIHIGQTSGIDCARGWLKISGCRHGASSADGRILGCYIHGLFASDVFRRQFLREHGVQTLQLNYNAYIDTILDDLANHIRTNLDLDQILSLAA